MSVNYHAQINMDGVFPTQPKNFYSSIFEPIVYKAYLKLSHFARKARVEYKFTILTRDLRLDEMEEEIYNLSKELPSRISMYDISIYTNEIWSIIYGKIENKLKKVMDEIYSGISQNELISYTTSKWTTLKERIDTHIHEAVKTLIEEDLDEEERYRLIVYIQGLTILKNVVENFLKKAIKEMDIIKGWTLGSQIILLSLYTTKYLSGTITPEDYLFSMEYAGEIFIKENEEETYYGDEIRHLEYISKI